MKIILIDVEHPRLMLKKYQGIHTDGYSKMMMNMLSGIEVKLGIDNLSNRQDYKPKKKLIYTRPIDEFFDFNLGRSKYRAQ